MALEVELIKKADYLLVNVSGTYDMEEAVEKFPLVLSSCRRNYLNKALIDYRLLKGRIDATQKLIYALGVKDHYELHLNSGGQPLQIALLGSPSHVTSYDPGMELAKSEDLPFMLTSDIDEALKWLGIHP